MTLDWNEINRRSEWQRWVESRPPNVAAAIRKLVPNPDGGLCVRDPGNGGHYWIEAWQEHDDGTVTVQVTHLADSFLPGVGVFGLSVDGLEPCGRGDGQESSAEQQSNMGMFLDLKLMQGQAAAAAAGQDWEALTPEERRGFLFGAGNAP